MCLPCFKFMCSKWIKGSSRFIRPIREALYYLWKHASVMKAWSKFCRSSGRHPIRFSRDV